MKILTLESENFKRPKAVEITPAGNMVKLTGKNAQGKTSVLDAIWVALAGLSSAPKAPINDNATEARIRVTLGERTQQGKQVELIVTRKFKRDSSKDKGYTTSLKVEGDTKGMSPQDCLDSLLSVLTFDPMDFMRMKPAEQFAMLRRFVPGVDFEKIDAQNQIDYSNRTELNRRAEQAKAAALKIAVPSDIPDTRIDDAELVRELAMAATNNQTILGRKAAREKLAGVIAADKAALEGLLAQVDQLKTKLETDSARLAAAPPLPALTDVADLQSRIESAKIVNAGIEQRETRDKYSTLAADLAKQSDDLTAAMNQRKADVQKSIEASKMPVKGVTFGDGVVLYKGLPLNQASDAEQIRISSEIAMADNPQLRVIRVRQGSLIDDDGMKVLAEIAKQRDFDVWIEIVDSSGKVGFVLEDGMVRKADETVAAQDAAKLPIPEPHATGFPYGKQDKPSDGLSAGLPQPALPMEDVL